MHAQVWIVTIAQDYESPNTVGVFASRDSAEQAAIAYIKDHHDYASVWPDREEDGKICWRIGDLYTLAAEVHEVKP